jgi:hypothetical protein
MLVMNLWDDMDIGINMESGEEMSLDIPGLDLGTVVQGLFNKARSLGIGLPMTEEGIRGGMAETH